MSHVPEEMEEKMECLAVFDYIMVRIFSSGRREIRTSFQDRASGSVKLVMKNHGYTNVIFHWLHF